MPLSNKSSKAEIKEFQSDLIGLGYAVGKVDGIIGSKTMGAAHDIADECKITEKFDGIIPDSVLLKVKELINAKRNPIIELPPNLFDLTNVSWPGPRKFQRAWNTITDITLHQTGCFMGENSKRWSYFENVNEKGERVVSSLKSHIGISQSGKIFLVHPLDSFIWHAQALSHHSISLEIDGAFCGIEGDLKTKPSGVKKIGSLTEPQKQSVINVIRWIKKVLVSKGSDLKGIYPHRIATDTRQPDPGSKVWQEIAIPMMKELNLTDGGKGYVTSKKGMPIPEAWNPEYKGILY